MRKLFRGLVATLAVGLAFVGSVWATPITFTPDLAGSSVTVSDSAPFGTLTANLVLSPASFTLGDGAIKSLDFFTLSASGLAINRSYTVAATLAFLDPFITATGSGGGVFSTLFGVLSGGTLTWNPATLPDTFHLADGNVVTVDFENGCAFGFGNTATVHAYITNDSAPVPEPGTVLLLGAGIFGIAICRHRRMQGRTEDV
ncbi:PEP-CTERM sorting domain-containing protein [Geomonas sp. RF6]|uniref:PEP-CTERM sorting domain-containing protein n=1 Tax=Geomonas sp. RF6 TaxID=2897342 RepID=UPI001E3525BB|nr:PEP-CTERM sorting domain-containing protein [Geomonas sp. RF6]UFS71381.1 PEP-CTERM sorting domain-containing protein [Geomonas sp. RF6]